MTSHSDVRTKDQKLSQTMEKLRVWMQAQPDKSVHRHPGGFWWNKDPASMLRSHCFGTGTVEALVTRGVAEWVEWQDGRNGRFPIQARLV